MLNFVYLLELLIWYFSQAGSHDFKSGGHLEHYKIVLRLVINDKSRSEHFGSQMGRGGPDLSSLW